MINVAKLFFSQVEQLNKWETQMRATKRYETAEYKIDELFTIVKLKIKEGIFDQIIEIRN